MIKKRVINGIINWSVWRWKEIIFLRDLQEEAVRSQVWFPSGSRWWWTQELLMAWRRWASVWSTRCHRTTGAAKNPGRRGSCCPRGSCLRRSPARSGPTSSWSPLRWETTRFPKTDHSQTCQSRSSADHRSMLSLRSMERSIERRPDGLYEHHLDQNSGNYSWKKTCEIVRNNIY